ncbi:unnamed protein product, partial [Prorocentrum cordatum]
GVHVAAARLLGEKIRSRVDLLRAEPREHDAPAPPAPSPTSRGRHHRRAASDERGELREPDGKSRNSQLSPRRAASGSASMSAFQFDASSEQRQPSSESPKRRGTAASRPSSALQESAGTSLRRCTTVSSVQDLRRCGQSQQEELVVVIVCNGEAGLSHAAPCWRAHWLRDPVAVFLLTPLLSASTPSTSG